MNVTLMCAIIFRPKNSDDMAMLPPPKELLKFDIIANKNYHSQKAALLPTKIYRIPKRPEKENLLPSIIYLIPQSPERDTIIDFDQQEDSKP